MTDMKFPRYIFTIGGAGKELLFAMLRKEWVLREILVPKADPTTVDITIIDTALDDENKDNDTIKEINEDITKISGEYSSRLTDSTKNIGRIRITYELLTKRMTLTTPSSLVEIGDDIKTAKLAKIWWINDPELGDDWLNKVMNHENLRHLDFSKGVYRKRAISKAIYYKAISANLFRPNILKNDQVDIIIGLGGGTGSGIAIDLANRLKIIQPTANITLFGILSTLNESRDEKANNFAMLTELEYCLNSGDDKLKNIFRNIILIPIEKTEYGGKQQTTHDDQKKLEEFDKTFAYMFISYHNTGKAAERLFSDLPDFAPYVIATSQLVHYNINAIKKFKEDLIKVLKDKEKSFDDEETLNSIKNTIDEYYTDETNAILSDQDELLIKDRFSKFEKVLGHKTFLDLKYEGVATLKKAVDAGILICNVPISGMPISSIDNHTRAGIESYITAIKSQVANYTVTTFKDDIDIILYNILKKDIEMIERRINVLKSINKVNDNTLKLALKSVIKGDQFNLGVYQQQITKEINALIDKGHQLDKKIQEWKQVNIKNIDILNIIDEFNIGLNKNIIYIKNELDEYANKLNSANRNRDINIVENLEVEKTLDRIYQDVLDKMGLEFKDKSSIVESMTYIKELRRNQIEYKKGVKLIHKLIGKARSIKQKIRNEIDRLTLEIDRRKVFKIKDDDTFISIYAPDIEVKINQKKDQFIDIIIKNTKDIFPNMSPITLTELKNTLKDYIMRKEIIIDDQTDISERLRLLRTFENKLTAIAPILATYSKTIGNYHDFIENMENNVEKMCREKRKTIYVTEAQPMNLFQIMAVDSDINGMIKNPQELTNLKTYLDDGLSRTLDTNYNVLLLNKIETSTGTKSWKKTRIMNSLVTIAQIGPGDINAERQTKDTFNPGGYADWVCPWGDPWEVGLVLFIAGVPLDNIRNVVDAKEGFYAKYKESEPKIFFYHSLMLEDGNLVKRKKVFNIDDEEEKALLLQNDSDVKKLYTENHEIVPIKDCL